MKNRVHIMIVDDDPYITMTLERILGEDGYIVTAVNDSSVALAMFAEQAPDLVLLDIRMPGLDGYQILERIRETSDVPVLMLTALRDQDAMKNSFYLGADDYIEKPFLSRVLIARIHAKLRRTRLAKRQRDGDNT